VRRWISVLDWLPHYRRADLPGDVVAGLHTIVLDASGVNHLDATADHQLRKLAARYRDRGIRLLFVNVDEDVRAVMDESGLTDLIGPDHFFATDADAVAHLDARR